MEIDNTQPWEESKVKLPKLGAVVEAILTIEKNRTTNNENLNVYLSSIETNVKSALKDFDDTLKSVILQHTDKVGPAHGETKETIGLGKKENLPAATLADIKAGRFKREFLTPETLSALIDHGLNIDETLYVKSGAFPLSYGVTLGRALFNQRYIGGTTAFTNESPAGLSQSLLSTEEGYLLFADHASGYDSNFSEGGVLAPVGTTLISIVNDNINTIKGAPASLTDITATDLFIATFTGREFGFSDNRGNYYDSNFHPTVKIDTDQLNSSPKQSIESTLFDPSLVYKPDGTYTFRNFDSTKHNFTELVPIMTGLFPFNDVSLLTTDNIALHTANCRIAKESNMWGICFDVVSGDVGTADWLKDDIKKATNKVLSKQAEYTIRQTTIKTFTGYDGGLGLIRLSTGQIPIGFSVNRANFDNSNFNDSPRYCSVFIPINSLIKGFNALTPENQQAILNRIDKELLKRITLSWDNKFVLSGVMRIPFYLNHASDDNVAWNCWVDLAFKLNVGPDYNLLDFNAINFDPKTIPSLDSSLNLTAPLGKFTQHTKKLQNDPLNPKVIGGCFVETGGHVRAYTVGQRQYVCYYKHQVTSKLDWIKNNKTPVITETEIKDVSLFPSNGFYGESLRTIPVITNGDKTTYLSYLRDKKGKYNYATFTVSPNFTLNKGMGNPESFNWLSRDGEKDIPILAINKELTGTSINLSGMVFSETNNFIGSFDPNFDGVSFTPVKPTQIEKLLKNRIIRNSKILNPYAIFFYMESTLHWIIMDKYGTQNSEGNDACFGAVRVDVFYDPDQKIYEIRQLPTMTEKYIWKRIYATPLNDGYYGRNKETFDDIFVTKKGDDVTKLSVYVNYAGLVGKYFDYTIERDGVGYYYPNGDSVDQINMDLLTGYGTKTPHNFYPSYQPVMLTPQHVYIFTQTLYGYVDVTSTGNENRVNRYMGWFDEFPLYVIGSNITVNGMSKLVDKTISLTGYDKHGGQVFITGDDEGFKAYSRKNNPENLTTEPSITSIFAGYWNKVGTVYTFAYHADRGISDLTYADFLNALLPVVDNKQLSPYKLGSTFPLYLGKNSKNPRQYYFKK